MTPNTTSGPDWLGSGAPWRPAGGAPTDRSVGAGGSPPSTWLWLVLAALLGLAATLRYAPWSVPLEPRDSHVFFFLSERIAHGVAPYQSLFSPHNALSVMIPGLGIALGELIGVDPVISARVVTVICMMATIAGVWLLVWRLTRNRGAAAVAMAFMLTFTPVAFHAASTGQPKSVLMPLVLATLIAVQAGRFGVAGVLSIACYLAYQPALLLVPPTFLAAALTDRRRQNLIAASAGLAITLGLYLGYLGWEGVLREWFVQTHEFMGATKTVDLAGPVHLREIIELWGSIWRGGFGSWNVTLGIFLATLLWLLVRAVWTPRATLQSVRGNLTWLVLIPVALGALAYGYADIGGVPDTYFLLPFIAVLGAIGVAAVIESAARRFGLGRFRTVAYLGAVLFCVWVFRQSPEVYRSRFKYTLADQRAAAAVVGKYLSGGKTVFVLGPVHLLAMNHADNWIKFGSSHSVRPTWGYWDYLYGPIPFVPARDGKLPEVIVWGGGQPLGWPAWLGTAGYAKVPNEILTPQGIELWVRNP